MVFQSAAIAALLTADKSSRSADAGNPQSWNRYWYGTGDPINVNDPSGNDPTCGPGRVWNGEGCMTSTGAGAYPNSNSGPSPMSLSSGQGASDIGQAEGSYVATTVVSGYIQAVLTSNPIPVPVPGVAAGGFATSTTLTFMGPDGISVALLSSSTFAARGSC